MIGAFSRRLALAAAFAVVPLAAAAAAQDRGVPEAPATPTAEPTAAATGTQAEDDKRICRFIKPDTSSRRKVKVCRTLEEWRELNNIR
jgi:hypothetical protein